MVNRSSRRGGDYIPRMGNGKMDFIVKKRFAVFIGFENKPGSGDTGFYSYFPPDYSIPQKGILGGPGTPEPVYARAFFRRDGGQ
jgi:hypothetical protein